MSWEMKTWLQRVGDDFNEEKNAPNWAGEFTTEGSLLKDGGGFSTQNESVK